MAHGAKRLWANCLWGEMSRPWGGTFIGYVGRNVHGANCPLGEKSINLIKRFPSVDALQTAQYCSDECTLSLHYLELQFSDGR